MKVAHTESVSSPGGADAGRADHAGGSRVSPRRFASGAAMAAALILVTCAVYWPVRQHGFVLFDDPEYYTDNANVQAGLSWAGVKWAFATGYFSYWHPLTWLSHMLDVELFGKSAAGPHLVNVVLHAANAALVSLLLLRLTGAVWRSAVVGALFALHPLHVESVAWVAERKDVLCAFFFLLSLHAYVRAQGARSGEAAGRRAGSPNPAGATVEVRGSMFSVRRSLAASLLLFTFALLAKPMAVTLPCVLLLLDGWPLGRFSPRGGWPALRPLLVEKIPFFALTVVASLVTYVVQRENEAVQSLHGFSFVGRIENAVVAYARYLGKTCWPTDLAFFYPHPGDWPALLVAGSVALLCGLTVGFLALVRRVPAGMFGWLMFLGMLVPTIGLIQVGGQSLADRYTYLPHVGLFTAVVWVASLVVRGTWTRAVAVVLAVSALLACAVGTRDQLTHWRDSESLFRHALAVTTNNFIAHNNLGNALAAAGRIDEAMAEYEQALALEPRSPSILNNLGVALLRRGRLDEAIERFRQALAVQPRLADARHSLCSALFQAGRAAEAVPYLRNILVSEPANAQVHADLGVALHRAGQPDQAIPHLRKALQLGIADSVTRAALGRCLLATGDIPAAVTELEAAVGLRPQPAETHYALALALFQAGQPESAVHHFRRVVELEPRNAEALGNLGWTLLTLELYEEAITRFEAALRVDPNAATVHTNLAVALQRVGRPRDAIARFELLLERQPEHAAARSDLAWLLSTWPDDEVRDGRRALGLALRAVELTGGRDPMILRALAAAQAETGSFAEAAATARRAIALAEEARDVPLAETVRAHLARYESRRPHREGESGRPAAPSGSEQP